MDILDGYPIITEITVAWGEMDALNHVNNVVYFRYFENARLHCFSELQLMEQMISTGIGPILRDTQCQYKLPVTYPDTLLVGSLVTALEDDRFTMEYQIVSKKLGKVTTLGEATIVMFDFNAQKKATVPAQLRQAIANKLMVKSPQN